jgi:hypothetical protein
MLAAVQLTETQARKAVPIYGVNFEMFGAIVGSPDLATRMRKAGWIKPVCQKPVLFDTGDIAKCWARIKEGDSPE